MDSYGFKRHLTRIWVAKFLTALAEVIKLIKKKDMLKILSSYGHYYLLIGNCDVQNKFINSRLLHSTTI